MWAVSAVLDGKIWSQTLHWPSFSTFVDVAGCGPIGGLDPGAAEGGMVGFADGICFAALLRDGLDPFPPLEAFDRFPGDADTVGAGRFFGRDLVFPFVFVPPFDLARALLSLAGRDHPPSGCTAAAAAMDGAIDGPQPLWESCRVAGRSSDACEL